MASVSISSMTKNLSTFLQDHKISFTNCMLILFTLGGEQIFRFSAFRCPCTQPEAFTYAIIFIVCPAIVLTILGVVINNVTWRICHGCCYRSKSAKHGCKNTCPYFIGVLARALIVPCAWIFMTLLDGNYFFCMMATAPCNRSSEEERDLVSRSQIISWIYLVTILGIMILVMFIARCLDSMTYFQNRFVIIYRDAEELQFEESLKTAADELAKSNVKEFVDSKNKKEDWDLISKVPQSTIKVTETDEKIHFTQLQQWSQEKMINKANEVPQQIDEHQI